MRLKTFGPNDTETEEDDTTDTTEIEDEGTKWEQQKPGDTDYEDFEDWNEDD